MGHITLFHESVSSYPVFIPKGAFQVGAKVLRRDFTRRKRKGGKMDPKWLGPYTIARDLRKGLYSLKAVDSADVVVSRVNGAHLKPYFSPPSSPVKVSI